MNHALMGFSASVLALAASGVAEACRNPIGNYAYRPVMADTVRAFPSIYLARAVSAQPIGGRSSAARDDYIAPYLYSFEVVETLKGDPVDQFTLELTRPFDSELPVACQKAGAVEEPADLCATAYGNLLNLAAARQSAESGRHDWSAFHLLRPNDDGLGFAEPVAPDVSFVDCGAVGVSLQLGETYLIMHEPGEDGETLAGLNYQLITREDDAWLAAVRELVARPQADWLPARSVEETLARFGAPVVLSRNDCSAGNGDFFEFIIEDPYWRDPSHSPAFWGSLVFYQREHGAEEYLRHCANDGEFLFYPDSLWGTDMDGRAFALMPAFPIVDGVIDFSHLPAQWEISEPHQVPLHEVITWSFERQD